MKKLITTIILLSLVLSLMSCGMAKTATQTITQKKITGTWTVSEISASDDSSDGLINKMKTALMKSMFKKDSEVSFTDTKIDFSANQVSVEYKLEDDKIYMKDSKTGEYDSYMTYKMEGNKLTLKYLTLTVELEEK